MQISVIGSGNMGSALTKQLTRAGHSVEIVARDLAKAQQLAASHPGATAATADAMGDPDLVILATYYDDAIPALRSLGSLAGKVIVDITNPVAADFMSLTIGHDTSAAEEIAKAFPDATVVKAFNTLFAQVISDGPEFANGALAPVLYASDSATAKQLVKTLIESTGFEAVDAGSLNNARYLEPLGGLNIYFGYGAGRGTGIAPTWLARA